MSRSGSATTVGTQQEAATRRSSGRDGSFFRLYKRGQGYYTRLGTAIGGGVLAIGGAAYTHDRLLGMLERDQAWTIWVRVGVPVAILAVAALVIWWLVGVKRQSCDFMIATEGEMKKVNWSSRQEVIGSTKVVIVFTLLLAAMLFLVDIAFATFFGAINVLQYNPIQALFETLGEG